MSGPDQPHLQDIDRENVTLSRKSVTIAQAFNTLHLP
jgi:hypothetical protein